MVEPLATLGLGIRAVELPSCVAPRKLRGTVRDMYADPTRSAPRRAMRTAVVLVGHSSAAAHTDAAAGPRTSSTSSTAWLCPSATDLAFLGGGGAGLDGPSPEDGTIA